MGKFSLQHVVLYAKDWYERENKCTIWQDLEKLIEADGYNGIITGYTEIQKQNKIAYIIVSHYGRIQYKGSQNSLVTFYEGIKDYNCYKIGYYTKTNTVNHITMSKEEKEKLPDYDYDEAVVRYCLSCLCALTTEEWNVCRPDFSILPRRKGITNKDVERVFEKKVVKA